MLFFSCQHCRVLKWFNFKAARKHLYPSGFRPQTGNRLGNFMKAAIAPSFVGRVLFTSLLVLDFGSVNAVARGQIVLTETTTPALIRSNVAGQPEFAPNYLAQRLGAVQKFTTLPGVAVRETKGRKLGKLEDMVVDLNSGRLLCVLVSHGSTVVAVPGAAFNSADKLAARINLNNVNFSTAPHAPSSDLAAVLGSLGESYSYFGERFNGDSTITARARKCSELIGARVRNNAGESLGTVVNLMVDLPTERVVYVLISFTGKDSDLYAVPPMAFQNSGEHSPLVLNIDKSRAESLSHDDGFFWSNLAESSWAINLYHAFGLHADFEATASLTRDISR